MKLGYWQNENTRLRSRCRLSGPSAFLGLFLIAAISLPVTAQKMLHGLVSDSETGEGLPAANIQIEGTYQGCISSREGRYSLRVDVLPTTVIFRYIGYHPVRVSVDQDSPDQLDIQLIPAPFESEAIVVTGEDPGMRLMRGVIEKKRQWLDSIQSFEAEAYSRQVLANDTGIAMITELLATAYWTRKRGLQYIIRSKRTTKNVDPNDLFDVGDEMVNLYDDDIELLGSNYIGVTNPKALEYYDFRIVGQRKVDQQMLYELEVRSKTRLQPTFEGTVSVLDEDSVLIRAELKPTDYVIFPMPIREFKVFFKQQFNNFGRIYWLPVDLRQDGSIKIAMPGLEFPRIRYTTLSGFSNYKMNVSLPDTLVKSKRSFIVDSVSLRKENAFDSAAAFIPLSDREDSAYMNIKRGDSFGKLFKPKGSLSRFVKIEDEYNDSVIVNKPKTFWQRGLERLSPDLRFNRVEGFHTGLKIKLIDRGPFLLTSRAGYAFQDDSWFYGGEARFKTSSTYRPWVGTDYYRGVESRFVSDNYPELVGSFMPLLGYSDYYDFYSSQRFGITAGMTLPLEISRSSQASGRDQVDVQLRYGQDIQKSAAKQTDLDLLGRKRPQPPNPAIEEGTLRSLTFGVQYGEDYIPFGFVGQNRIELNVEYSSSSILLSDFDFVTYKMSADWRFPTFLQRRMLPNVLDVHVVAGTYTGHLPVQRFSIIDGSLHAFTPFGSFKTLRGDHYEGEKYAAVYWEHNFRTVPFELIGLRWFAEKSISVLIHGASGRTWISKQRFPALGYLPNVPGRFHHEIGASLSGIFGLFRLDATRRLDRRDFFLGLSAARLF